MCGIIGILSYGELETKSMETTRQEAMIFLVSELLQLTESRGKDATGIATLFKNCDYMALKMGVSATEFVSRFGQKETDFAGYLNVWRKTRSTAGMVIGHCRKPSAGGDAGPENNKNNHPIKVNNIIGVHNGTLTNHAKIIDNIKYKSDGKVDSEAIFGLLDFYTKQGKEPFSLELLENTCNRLHGSFACLSFSGNNPFQMAAFRDDRPMVISIIRPLKLVVIASEEAFIKRAIFRYNRFAQLYKMAGPSFPPLRKGDVQIESMPDKTAFLFDVRQDISKNTMAEDVYLSKKIPVTGKLWGNTVVYNNCNRFNNTRTKVNATNRNVPAVITKKAQEEKKTDDNSTTGTKTTDESFGARLGMAWNRQRSKYESVSTEKKTKEHGFVDMSVDTEEIKDALTSEPVIIDDSEFVLKKTENKVTKSVITPSINVDVPEEPDQKEIQQPTKTETKAVTETVNVKVYPEALELATQAALNINNFASDEEVCNKFGLVNPTYLNTMATYCLMNRARRSFYKEGWYAGYVENLRNGKNVIPSVKTSENLWEMQKTMLKKTREKQIVIQKSIRMTKSIMKLFSKLNTDYDEEKIKKVVKEAIESGKKFDMESLRKLFKSGDLRDSLLLKQIFQTIDDLQKKGEDETNGPKKIDSSTIG